MSRMNLLHPMDFSHMNSQRAYLLRSPKEAFVRLSSAGLLSTCFRNMHTFTRSTWYLVFVLPFLNPASCLEMFLRIRHWPR